ncbi:hypothetical protein H6G83_25695 [Anabaena azotica FACHB-119]|uniref:Uncharacterized protein n=1 Tax=Anabaena azotica FACHB-119 TaxID=947527 RepID=A0ABR8DCU5_9NOST|nr:hypothetical protein [Anabaena azotica FACHB-119]
MKKLKYCAITALGAILLTLGVTVGARAAITGVRVKNWQSWGASITLILIGSRLKGLGLKNLFKILTDEEIEYILQRRLQEIPKPCRGCQNFHGGIYGGVILVCGIHAHGVKGDNCADYKTSKGARKI